MLKFSISNNTDINNNDQLNNYFKIIFECFRVYPLINYIF